ASAAAAAARAAAQAAPAPEDAPFLDELQRRAFLYFWEQSDPKTGLTLDRAGNFGGETQAPASMAATGFGLTALGIAVERGWVPREEAYARALACLRHLFHRQPHVRGWFHHFVDAATGEPAAGSEVSTIDTALLLAGALSAGRYFAGTEVERLAAALYARVDFPWMMTDGGADPRQRTLSMGWTPQGFLKARWDAYSEHLVLYMLGLGSPTHPLPADAWTAWRRPEAPVTQASGPLFTHQFSQLWLDLRGRRDAGHDYFDQSVRATLLHRDTAVAAAKDFATYGPNCWGWTACDGPEGYRAYGADPAGPVHDGTIAPAAAGGSAAFTPALSIAALRWMKETYGGRIWGRYGFSDAFNTDPRWRGRFNADGMWRSPDAVGIDQGAILLAVENARTGGVWKNFMGLAPVRRAFARAKLERAAPPAARLRFSGVGGRDVYTPTAPFTARLRGRKAAVLAARVEARSSESSETMFFEEVRGRWRPLAGAPVFKLQDPFLTLVGRELVLGGVETFPKPDGGLGYRTVFYRGRDLARLKPFARGPDGMKDIRLLALPGGKLLVLTRPQGAVGGRGKVGAVVLGGLADLGPAALARAALFTDLFGPEEWGGANELHRLKNGWVGVLGHVARFDEDGNRHYAPMAFAFDPATGRRTPPKVLLTRAQLPPGASKRPDLTDVLFSGGLVRRPDGTAELYLGAGDAEVYRVTLPDPFLGFESLPG
ncbi:MAG: DUF1861 family protein, partial [Elusimicrobia bacterium]|nr:DUF1861 family protein [Elusimicrobiota bacterium]